MRAARSPVTASMAPASHWASSAVGATTSADRPPLLVARTRSAIWAPWRPGSAVHTALGASPRARCAASAAPAGYPDHTWSLSEPSPAAVGAEGRGADRSAMTKRSARACRAGTATDRTWEDVARKRRAMREASSSWVGVVTGRSETTRSRAAMRAPMGPRRRDTIHPLDRVPARVTRTRRPTWASPLSSSGTA